jgi:hypothetical protein
MQHVDCEFEAEVLTAVLQSRWPHRADPQLQKHAETCTVCSDVAAVAGFIDQAREQTRAAPSLPDSGRVWWLAQVKARREAAKSAGRPITATQMIAGAAAVGFSGACFGATSRWFQEALAGFSLSAAFAEHTALAIGMAAVIILVPAAAWLALRRD